MSAGRLKWLAAAVLVGLMLAATGSSAQEKDKDKKDKLDLDKIPKAVMDALKSKFPKAEITQWEKATEAGVVIYDLEFKSEGRKCEMDVKEDGTIINIEREIAAKDLPAAVSKAVEKRYPKGTLKEIMEIKAAKGKVEEVLEGYEVVLESADKKVVELMVAPDGKILEEEIDGKKVEIK